MSDEQIQLPQHDEWHYDKAGTIKGEGPRPEFLEKGCKSIEEQAERYKHLHKSFSASGAPEAYDLGEHAGKIDATKLEDFMKYAKENRINQETFSKIVGTMADYQRSLEPDYETEMAKLGEDAHRRVQTIKAWAENNLSPKAAQVIGKIGKTAEVMEFLDELRQYDHHQKTVTIPNLQTQRDTGFKKMTVAEAKQMIVDNFKRYQEDPKFRAECARAIEQAVGTG